MPERLLFTCAGCGKDNLSDTGYWAHLSLSHDPRCIEVRQETNRAVAMDIDSESSDGEDNGTATPSAGSDQDPQLVPFTGDAFGTADDYMDDDFGQVDNPHSGDLDATGDLDANIADGDTEGILDAGQRAVEAELEGGWEPVRGDRHEPIVADVETPSDENGDATAAAAAEARSQAEQRASAPPKIVSYSDTYPHRKAGAIVEHAQSSDQTYSAADDTNIWAPFTSKIDWEIAKWAKLRGAGSTAFSDLLAIEGVCIFCYFQFSPACT